jgi:hypothetical protein
MAMSDGERPFSFPCFLVIRLTVSVSCMRAGPGQDSHGHGHGHGHGFLRGLAWRRVCVLASLCSLSILPFFIRWSPFLYFSLFNSLW